MMKKENGITLIALVITIIVLLILAAVTIAMLTSDNGILTKANTAVENNQKAEGDEALRLAVDTALAEKLDPNNNKDAITVDDLTDSEGKFNKNVTLEASNGSDGLINVTVKVNGKEVSTHTVKATTGEIDPE